MLRRAEPAAGGNGGESGSRALRGLQRGCGAAVQRSGHCGRGTGRGAACRLPETARPLQQSHALGDNDLPQLVLHHGQLMTAGSILAILIMQFQAQ